MKYISLNNRSLSTFITKSELSQLGGSSMYNVFENEIVMKERRSSGKIENESAIQGILNEYIYDNMSDSVARRLKISYLRQLILCSEHKFTSESELNRLELLKNIFDMNRQNGNELSIKKRLIHENILQQESMYQTARHIKNSERKINKGKVSKKIYSLFNLRCSAKFIAFFSVSFPSQISDNTCFICWNYWLTCLRKKFNLENYIWVTERQKNGTLHYHMLTNNYMPVLQINRAMAIIINNQVDAGNCSWGNSCINRYNGVDVDSIYNSKRHKKTGKILNKSEVRRWLSKYVTKYVTKNNEKFEHLCWHCSRSVSMLFTTVMYNFKDKDKIFPYLPDFENANTLYIHLHSDYNDTYVFKFEPNIQLFLTLFWFNDLIFKDYEPVPYVSRSNYNYKSTNLN